MNKIDPIARNGRVQPNHPRHPRRLLAGLTILAGALGASAVAQAATYSVGPGADGCTHTTLAAAVATAATASGGPHLIKLRSAFSISLASQISVENQTADITFEGGYASCGDSAPQPNDFTIIHRDPAVATLGLFRFSNNNANPRRTIRMERTSLRNGSGAVLEGGALTLAGNLTVELGRFSQIQNNQGRGSGGIFLFNVSTEQDTRTELILGHGATVSGNRTSVLNAAGGGIHGIGNVRVTIQQASFTDNRSHTRGGAIYLTGAAARLWLDPTPQLLILGIIGAPLVSFSNNEAGPRAFDPDAPFNAASGFGGAVALRDGAELSSAGGRSANRPGVRFWNNRANFGGAISAEGTTGPHAFAVLRNTEVVENRAYGKGGAFYVKNAMDFQFLSSGAGPCQIGTVIIGFPGTGDPRRLPCSRAIDNVVDNEEANHAFPGGGVAYVTTDAGSGRAIFRSGGALYQDNADPNGTAAVAAAWQNDSKLAFVRSIFDGNQAGGFAGTRAMIDSDSNDVTFFFNTVVGQHPDTSLLFYTGSGAAAKLVEAQGSIFWQGVSTPITNEPTAGKVVPGLDGQHCLNLHSAHASELSATGGAIYARDPRLDAVYAPRPRGGAIDLCANAARRGDVHYPLEFDAWGLPTNINVPSITNVFGPVDAGAIEQGDIIMYNGFGSYPDS